MAEFETDSFRLPEHLLTHTIPAAALRIGNVQDHDDQSDVEYVTISSEFHRDLVRATRLIRRAQLSTLPSIDAAVKKLSHARKAAPDLAKRYKEGQRELVVTRRRNYVETPAVSLKPTRKVVKRSTARKGKAGSGKKLGAGDGQGSDDSDDNDKRKRRLPKDANEPHPRRKKKRKEDEDKSKEDSGELSDYKSESATQDAQRAGAVNHDANGTDQSHNGLRHPYQTILRQTAPITPRLTTEATLDRLATVLPADALIDWNDIRYGDHSIHLDKYLLDMLSHPKASDPEFVCTAVHTVHQLVSINGRGSLWGDAGHIENYVTFGINEEEIWENRWLDSNADPEADEYCRFKRPRLGPRWNCKWSRIAGQLDRMHDIGKLYERAQRMTGLSDDDPFMFGIKDVGDLSADEYVLALGNEVRECEWRYHEKAWRSRSKLLTKDFDAQGALAARLNKEFALMYQAYRGGGAAAFGPNEQYIRIACGYILDKGEKAFVDSSEGRAVKARFDNMMGFITDMIDIEQYLDLPRWPGFLTMEDYCESLSDAIHAHRNKSLRVQKEAWQHAIKVADTVGNDMRAADLTIGFDLMMTHTENGGIPFSVKVWDTDKIDKLFTGPRVEQIGFDGQRTRHPDLEADDCWTFHKIVGTGGFGSVSLWVKEDGHDNVTKRVAIKEVYVDRPKRDLWNVKKHWHGSMKARLPREASINMDLNNLKGSENIVRCLAYSVYDIQKMYRLYLEFCPHGDLNGLIKQYRDRHEYIPPRILWSILEALTAALCIMQLGHLPHTPLDKPTHHTPIIHQDIKPGNIFLRAPHETFWPGIPQSVLGDFGLADRVDRPGFGKPGLGTRGFRAPEQQRLPSTHPHYEPFPVGPHSEIWVVGRVMLSLMDKTMKIPDFSFDDENETPEAGSLEFYVREDANLCHVVQGCLWKDAGKRWRVGDLWARVRREVATTRGLRGRRVMMKMEEKPEDEIGLVLGNEVELAR